MLENCEVIIPRIRDFEIVFEEHHLGSSVVFVLREYALYCHGQIRLNRAVNCGKSNLRSFLILPAVTQRALRRAWKLVSLCLLNLDIDIWSASNTSTRSCGIPFNLLAPPNYPRKYKAKKSKTHLEWCSQPCHSLGVDQWLQNMANVWTEWHYDYARWAAAV